MTHICDRCQSAGAEVVDDEGRKFHKECARSQKKEEGIHFPAPAVVEDMDQL